MWFHDNLIHKCLFQSFDENKLEYYIEWDDQDPSGRNIPIEHLAVNKPPFLDEIG